MITPLNRQPYLLAQAAGMILLFLLISGCLGAPSNGEQKDSIGDTETVLPDAKTDSPVQGASDAGIEQGDLDMDPLSPLVINGIINGAFQREGAGDLPEWFMFSFPNWYSNEPISEWKTYGAYPSILTIDPNKPHGTYLPDEQDPNKTIFEDASGEKTSIVVEPASAESIRLNGVVYKRRFSTKLNVKLDATPQERYAAAGPAFPGEKTINGTYGVVLSTTAYNGEVELYQSWISFTPDGLYASNDPFPVSPQAKLGDEGIQKYVLEDGKLVLTDPNGSEEKRPFTKFEDSYNDASVEMTSTYQTYDPTMYNLYHAYVWKAATSTRTYHRIDYPYDGFLLDGAYARNTTYYTGGGGLYFYPFGVVVFKGNTYDSQYALPEDKEGVRVGTYLILGNTLHIYWTDGGFSNLTFNLAQVSDASTASPKKLYIDGDLYEYMGTPPQTDETIDISAAQATDTEDTTVASPTPSVPSSVSPAGTTPFPLLDGPYINGAFQREGTGPLPEWIVFGYTDWVQFGPLDSFKQYSMDNYPGNHIPSLLDPEKGPYPYYTLEGTNTLKLFWMNKGAGNDDYSLDFKVTGDNTITLDGVTYTRKFAPYK